MTEAIDTLLADARCLLDSARRELRDLSSNLRVTNNFFPLPSRNLVPCMTSIVRKVSMVPAETTMVGSPNPQIGLGRLVRGPTEIIDLTGAVSNPTFQIEIVEITPRSGAAAPQQALPVAAEVASAPVVQRRRSARLLQRAGIARSASPVIQPPIKKRNTAGSGDGYLCPICMESCFKNEPTATPCGHVFCRKCILTALRSSLDCPICKKGISSSRLTRLFI